MMLISFFISPAIFAQPDTLWVPQEYANIPAALAAAETNDRILVSPGTYSFGGSWPNVYGIQLIGVAGSDSTIIDRAGGGRALVKDLFSDDFDSLIQGFTIRNAKGTQGDGGGVFIEGEGTTLRDLVIENCESEAHNAYGGGISLENYAGLIEDCTFRNNEAHGFWTSRGGGISIIST